MPTIDRVQVMKQESTAQGGDDTDIKEYGPTPIEPQEDAIEAVGMYFQDAGNRDEQVFAWRDGNDLKFKDVNNPTPSTLTDLISGAGGLTETAHRTLRQLIHFIEEGPAEGFASGAYLEILPAADPFPTSFIWWTSAAKTAKIVEETVTYNTNKTINTDQWKMYDTDGTTVLATVTDTMAYSGVFETSRTRTIA